MHCKNRKVDFRGREGVHDLLDGLVCGKRLGELFPGLWTELVGVKRDDLDGLVGGQRLGELFPGLWTEVVAVKIDGLDGLFCGQRLRHLHPGLWTKLAAGKTAKKGERRKDRKINVSEGNLFLATTSHHMPIKHLSYQSNEQRARRGSGAKHQQPKSPPKPLT